MTDRPHDSAGRQVCCQGELVLESEAAVPVTDRSYLYGDGVFETLRVYGGVPFAWERHWERMLHGCELLGLQPPEAGKVRAGVGRLLASNRVGDGVLRVQLSRGPGPRGYAPLNSGPTQWVVTTHPGPAVGPDQPRPVRVVTASWRVLSGARLAACKSASRMVQVLAAGEAQTHGADEALLLNERQEVAEASGANFFWVQDGEVCTPPLDSGALEGVTRGWVLEVARELGIPTGVRPLAAAELGRVETAFLTSSVLELQRVTTLDGRVLRERAVVDRLHEAYRRKVECYCASERPVADGSPA